MDWDKRLICSLTRPDCIACDLWTMICIQIVTIHFCFMEKFWYLFRWRSWKTDLKKHLTSFWGKMKVTVFWNHGIHRTSMLAKLKACTHFIAGTYCLFRDRATSVLCIAHWSLDVLQSKSSRHAGKWFSLPPHMAWTSVFVYALDGQLCHYYKDHQRMPLPALSAAGGHTCCPDLDSGAKCPKMILSIENQVPGFLSNF